jgi:hypothetical protein
LSRPAGGFPSAAKASWRPRCGPGVPQSDGCDGSRLSSPDPPGAEGRRSPSRGSGFTQGASASSRVGRSPRARQEWDERRALPRAAATLVPQSGPSAHFTPLSMFHVKRRRPTARSRPNDPALARPAAQRPDRLPPGATGHRAARASLAPSRRRHDPPIGAHKFGPQSPSPDRLPSVPHRCSETTSQPGGRTNATCPSRSMPRSHLRRSTSATAHLRAWETKPAPTVPLMP